MDSYVVSLILLATLVGVVTIANADSTFDVMNFGAAGDGITDDTEAFVKAWTATCSAGTGTSTLIVPETKSFLVRQIWFLGPCRTVTINIMLSGTIIAPDGPSNWKESDISTWLTFKQVSTLNIFGNGLIDGRGHGWWDVSCKYHPHLKGCGFLAPASIKFWSCDHVNVKQISLRNSPQIHIHLLGTNNVEISWIRIDSPGNSPNTDGIHIQSCNNVAISHSTIGSGDDCVSIGDHTSDINITDINCGPGHGISVGSLGKGGSEVSVHNIAVNEARFIGTTNGVRIKTWQGGRGEARNITFSNLNFTAVKNPIIIDQYYCIVPFHCSKTQAGVHISDVVYQNAFGSSVSEIGVNLNCSNVAPCTNIVLDTVILSSTIHGKTMEASCNFAHGSAFGTVSPPSCLSP